MRLFITKMENPTDNRLDNLELLSRSEHTRIHKQGAERKTITCDKDGCNNTREIRKSFYKWRKANGQENWYCSTKCKDKDHSPDDLSYLHESNRLDIDELLIKEVKNGKSGHQIAKEHDLNKKTVYSHLKELDTEGKIDYY